MKKLMVFFLLASAVISAQNLKVSLPCVPSPKKGAKVTAAIKAQGFSDIAAVTLKIRFNPEALKLDSISRKNEFIYGVNNNIITIVRAALSPVTLQKNNLVNLYFTYKGGESELNFTSDCELSSLTKGVLPAEYTNGMVADSCSQVSIGSLTPAGKNSQISIPVYVSGFKSIGAVGLRISYNPAVLNFESVSDGFIAGTENGVITVAGISLEGFPAEGKLFNLNFTYIEGTSELKFDFNGVVEIVDINGIAPECLQYAGGIVNNWTTGVETGAAVIPGRFSLSQNYPNPFNPETKFTVSIPSESSVNVNVYNMLGEQVSSLVNDILPAGNYEYSFNASQLGSGVYIYKIQADNFMDCKKMTLLK